jgi:WhiB family transcriptional regulator, redox-sensing transcriptional regulator
MEGRWEDYAFCNELDTNIFFPERGQGGGRAKAVCKQCPVKRDCLRHALDNPDIVGIWGGTTEHERRTMRRMRTLLEVASTLSSSTLHMDKQPQ